MPKLPKAVGDAMALIAHDDSCQEYFGGDCGCRKASVLRATLRVYLAGMKDAAKLVDRMALPDEKPIVDSLRKRIRAREKELRDADPR